MKKYKLSELVLDFELYPRGSVDTQHVSEIAAAIESGATMPPIVIDKKSKRITDGFHRWKANRKLHGEDFSIQCVEKAYETEADMFLDAMKFNASHGRALTQHDKTHCLILGEKFNLSEAVVASALNLTTARIGKLRTGRISKVGARQIALKQTISHMAGRRLTKSQETANEKLSGMNQLFYVNQVKILIENNLVDMNNTELLSGLVTLRELLDIMFKKSA